ncbi:MAG: hypothetical protein ABI146_09630, partial [Nitrobacter sp.]
RVFDESKFLSEVKSVHDRLGRCVIALSEGIHDAAGTPLSVKLAPTVEKDAHGNVQLSGSGALANLLCDRIKSTLGIVRVRGDTFGYLQRSFDGCASDVDRREAREVGEFAVKQAIWGTADGSVTIRRIGDYAVDYALVKLAAVAGKTKVWRMRLSRPRAATSHLHSLPICGRCSAAACPPARECYHQGAALEGGVLSGRDELSTSKWMSSFRPCTAGLLLDIVVIVGR